MTDYKILSAYGLHSPQALEREVLKHIEIGYEPIGGVSVGRAKYGDGDTIFLAQAVIKKEDVQGKVNSVYRFAACVTIIDAGIIYENEKTLLKVTVLDHEQTKWRLTIDANSGWLISKDMVIQNCGE